MKSYSFNKEDASLSFYYDGIQYKFKINAVTGDITLYAGDDLINKTQTSYFDTENLYNVLHENNFSQEEITYLTYTVFISRFFTLLGTSTPALRQGVTDTLVVRNKVFTKELIAVYSLLYGEDTWKVSDNLITISAETDHLKVCTQMGGFLSKDCKEIYLSSFKVLTLSSQGITLSTGRDYDDVRLYDNGDTRHTSCNPYHKFITLGINKDTKYLKYCKEMLKGLDIITLADIIDLNSLSNDADDDFQSVFVAEISNIILK